jgi:hypothetical protein
MDSRLAAHWCWAGSEERRKIRQGKKRTTVRRQEASCISAGGHRTELQFLLAAALRCSCIASLTLTNNYMCM